MNPDFVPADIERAAQAAWRTADAYRVGEDARRPKFYACSMLPYPSGKLHMGHVRNYTINDMMARQLRMQGKNVLMPMGWDAFGLPAENAAIANNVPPAQWTRANIAEMKAQMEPLGLSIDWSREVATCDPSYYRWNQWFFLQLLKAGLAYKKTQTVNWDPVDQTVLANEQVIDGRGWRSGALVEKREIPGYYLAITHYAEELLRNVAEPADNPGFLHGWPERVRLMQEHWIGKSVGVRLAFPHTVVGDDGVPVQGGRLWVFTTRADTLMGVTFCAVAAEHPLALLAAQRNPAVAAFAAQCAQGGVTEAEIATKDKLGIDTGMVVQHPLTGADVPVWIGNYVLMGYGDGAVMGVPAHDERDFAFAAKYGIDSLQVVAVAGEHYRYDHWQDWYGDKTRGVTINSDNFSGLSSADAVEAIAAALAAKGLGEKKTTWRLRDWGISRQRYWGTPIPIIHCAACGDVPVPEADLPVLLPEHLIPDGSGNPLAQCGAFVNVPCPQCGAASRRETDTMDTFVDSTWYFMRYCCPDSDTAMVDARAGHWMPMDQYIGGIEHAVLHLLYARFWTKAMRDLGLVGYGEPFSRLFTQGMLLNESYYRDEAPADGVDGATASGRRQWFYPNEVELRTDERGRPVAATAKADGLPVQLGGIEKMSKSKNNVVEPRDIIARYGADTARLFTMFAGPPDQSAAWSDAGAEGAHRYLRRLWNFGVQQRASVAALPVDAADGGTLGVTTAETGTALPGYGMAESTPVAGPSGSSGPAASVARDLRREVHRLLQQITHDYERLQYNTVVSGTMKLLNALEAAAAKASAVAGGPLAAALHEGLGVLLRAVYPVAPHIAAVLWTELAYDREHGPLLDTPWPAVDVDALRQDTLTLMLQVNGKLRGEVTVPASADAAAIEAAALASPDLARFAERRTPRKVVIVPGRLVNVVV